MAKSNSQRFDEALATLLQLGSSKNQAIYKAYLGVLEWLDSQASRSSAINTVGGKISLGKYSGNSPQLKEHRKAVRALLLLLATRYAKTNSELSKTGSSYKDYKSAIDTNKVIKELTNNSQGIVVSTSGIVVAPEIYISASQEFKLPDVALVLRTGRDKARDIVQKGHANLIAKGEDINYKMWFGDASPERMAQVKQNLEKVLKGIHSKSIYFKNALNKATWGTAMPQSFDTFMQEKYVSINLGDYFYTASGKHSKQKDFPQDKFDSTIKKNMKLQDQEKNVRSQFFQDIKADGADIAKLEKAMDEQIEKIKEQRKKNAAAFKSGGDVISYAGVIVHEATHNIVRTTDVEVSGYTMYGPNFCRWLAQNHPDKAVNNADSYRLYCEMFL
ncbi:Lysine-specific metallo-endopeptidase [Alteromonadaceae bacterium Bs31]|nr:Lysine-specific metallo-endopeptidase [Alteromonadaceae bacterium Bs31]